MPNTADQLQLTRTCGHKPYKLRMKSSTLHQRRQMKSPLELFSKSLVRPNLDHFQPFGFPVFVLDANVQAGKKLPKW
jgi:hypothetical protein